MNTFWKIFDERLELSHRALQARHERLSHANADVSPILWRYGALARLPQGESIHELLHHGYSTISLGYAGLYECIHYMTGGSQLDEEGKAFGLSVMKHLNDACNKWRELTNISFSLYGRNRNHGFGKC